MNVFWHPSKSLRASNPHKIEFSFLNANLMVPASHRLISIKW